MTAEKDWSPGAYGRFRGFRLRPAVDLLAQVPADLPPGAVVDLGCGAGAAGPVLAARFPDRRRIGIDSSPAMLEAAARTTSYDTVLAADIASWRPASPPALIFTNAALNWVPNHTALLPRLAGYLPDGGVLAMQVPDQQAAPSHAALRSLAAKLFPDRFDWRGWAPEVLAPDAYARLLPPLGRLDLWRTTYHQILPPTPDGIGHPVRRFTESTVARPILSRLNGGEAQRFLAVYDAAMAEAYPAASDGTVLFPFQRLFLVLQRSAPPA